MKVSWRTKHYGKSECKQSHLRGGMSLSILLAIPSVQIRSSKVLLLMIRAVQRSQVPVHSTATQTIQGQIIYRKARNSVLLDSTGDVIEDSY